MGSRYASEAAVAADGPLACTAEMVECWSSLVAPRAPTPHDPKCGVRGYGLNCTGAAGRRLVDVVRARCAPRAAPTPCRLPRLLNASELPPGEDEAEPAPDRRPTPSKATGANPVAAGAKPPNAARAPAANARKRASTGEPAGKAKAPRIIAPKDVEWCAADVLYNGAWLRAEAKRIPEPSGVVLARWRVHGCRSLSEHERAEIRYIATD